VACFRNTRVSVRQLDLINAPHRDEHLGRDYRQCEDGGDEEQRQRHQQLRCGPHGADVGPDVDGVCEQQQGDHRVDQLDPVPVTHHRREAAPGDRADARARLLDGREQGHGEERGPQLPVAELGADLDIGRDTRWIVIGRSGDQARAYLREEPPQSRDADGHRRALFPAGWDRWSWFVQRWAAFVFTVGVSQGLPLGSPGPSRGHPRLGSEARRRRGAG
jgi:hypothetical protein